MIKRHLNIAVVGIPKVTHNITWHGIDSIVPYRIYNKVWHNIADIVWNENLFHVVICSHYFLHVLSCISNTVCYDTMQTIDNDVDLIDRSFGFTTSVEAAQTAILSAKTEARCNMPNGIGETCCILKRKSEGEEEGYTKEEKRRVE